MSYDINAFVDQYADGLVSDGTRAAVGMTRDRLMQQLDAECPGYGWARNKGYGTADHARGLATLGVTAHHRRSYAPIRKYLTA